MCVGPCGYAFVQLDIICGRLHRTPLKMASNNKVWQCFHMNYLEVLELNLEHSVKCSHSRTSWLRHQVLYMGVCQTVISYHLTALL